MRRVITAALTLLIAGCLVTTQGPTPVFSVALDARFTTRERAAFDYAAYSWLQAYPGLAFAGDGVTITVYRSTGTDDPRCRLETWEAGAYHYGDHRMCIRADYAADPRIYIHELGHAFDLTYPDNPDNPRHAGHPPSAMMPNIGQGGDTISCQDIEAMERRWHLGVTCP